jgi:hypothetical protein
MRPHRAMRSQSRLFHWFSMVAVSWYLLLCSGWLLLRGKIDLRAVWRAVSTNPRRRWRGPLANLRPELGRCFLGAVDRRMPSDADFGSRLVVLENGVPLTAAHCSHDDIRRLGQGRYSHWGAQVYFAASDDSDPRSNGRAYTAEER